MSDDKQKKIAKLRKILDRLSRGEIVQNRQLKTVLSEYSYARYLDDYRNQTEMRNWIKEKPSIILEYEKRFKAATFAYSKAEAMSAKGKSKRIEEMFDNSDTKFERLNEFLREKIEGHPELEAWFDRPIHTGPDNSFSLTPNAFPQIVTSRSIRNQGGGHAANLKTIRKVKIDAVAGEIEALQSTTDHEKNQLTFEANQQRMLRLLKKYRE